MMHHPVQEAMKKQGHHIIAVMQRKWTPRLQMTELNGLNHCLGPAPSPSLPMRVQVTKQQKKDQNREPTFRQSLHLPPCL